ncbi:MAG: ROK family protein [Clostridiales bacterium]|nr:ROK family protein [Clostridiales bacterium]
MTKHYVGVDIGGTKMLMLYPTENGYIEKKVPTGRDCPPQQLKAELDAFLAELPFAPDGVGMAIPGLVDDGHTVRISNVVPLLAGVTGEYFGAGRFPVRFLNDVKAAVLAEAAHYPADAVVAVIMAGTGIALGISDKGELSAGSHGFAGELGFSVTDTPEGVQTFDQLAGGGPLLQQAGCTPQELHERLARGDRAAVALIERAGMYFGLAMTNIMHLFDPDVLVVGGSTSTYPGYMEKALETADAHTLPDIRRGCTVARPRDMKRIAALGAWELIRR